MKKQDTNKEQIIDDVDLVFTKSEEVPQDFLQKISEEDIKRELAQKRAQEEEAEEDEFYDENAPLEPHTMRDVRALVFQFLYALEQFDNSVSIESVIDNFVRGFNLNITDDNQAIKMAKEVAKSRVELDEKVAPLLKNWKIDRLGCCTLLILRIAMWELLYNKELSSSIVMNEAIELAKSFGEKNSYKFINGILDEAVKSLGLESPVVEGLEVK